MLWSDTAQKRTLGALIRVLALEQGGTSLWEIRMQQPALTMQCVYLPGALHSYRNMPSSFRRVAKQCSVARRPSEMGFTRLSTACLDKASCTTG